MRIALVLIVAFGMSWNAFSQLYVLKDHRPDSNLFAPMLFDSLPEMCDSFFTQLKKEDVNTIKSFVPTMKYLKITFDTLAVEYTLDKVVIRQQMMLRSLQRQYLKILKKAKKDKLKMRHLVYQKTDYDYGEDEKGNRYCYVTVHCNKRKKEYELKYVAIRLNGMWFLGDELKFEKVE